MSVAGGAGRDAVHIQYETQRTQEAFGERPRVHTIIHLQWRMSMGVACLMDAMDAALGAPICKIMIMIAAG